MLYQLSDCYAFGPSAFPVSISFNLKRDPCGMSGVCNVFEVVNEGMHTGRKNQICAAQVSGVGYEFFERSQTVIVSAFRQTQ